MTAILFGSFFAWSQNETYQLIKTMNLKNRRVAPFENTIKMYDIAIDPVRKLAYTAGSMTEYIAVIDLMQAQQIAAFKHGWSHQLVNFNLNPSNGYLLVNAPQESKKEQRLFDPETGQLMGSYTYQAASGSGMAFDDSANRIYLADGNDVVVLDGGNMEVLSQFRVGPDRVGTQQNSIGELGFAMGELFIGSRNLIDGRARVDVYDPNHPDTLLRSYTAVSDEPLGALFIDPDSDRLILAGKRNVVVVSLKSGQQVRSFSTPEDTGDCDYSPETGMCYQITKEGWSDGGEMSIWGKLYVTDLATGTQTVHKTGEYTHRLAVSSSPAMVAWPCMHSGYLDVVDAWSLNPLYRVDLGESIAGMALNPDSEGVFIVERLGGNKTYQYDIDSDAFRDFPAPYWPCAVEVDLDLNKVFVLSHNESSIYAYDLAYPDDPISIRLAGLEPGVTDAIGVMEWDNLHKRGYASLPETERIGVFDGIDNTWVESFKIDGFRFNENHHIAVGNIQLAVCPKLNLLFVLLKYEKILQSYNMKNYQLVAQRDLSQEWPEKIGDLAADILVFDAYKKGLWVANHCYQPITLATLQAAPGDSRLLGYKPDQSVVYFIAQNGQTGMLQIIERDPRSLAAIQTRDLYAIDFGCPVMAYDETRGHIWIGEFQNVNLRCYDLQSPQPKP